MDGPIRITKPNGTNEVVGPDNPIPTYETDPPEGTPTSHFQVYQDTAGQTIAMKRDGRLIATWEYISVDSLDDVPEVD
jgi:hypothetical protein